MIGISTVFARLALPTLLSAALVGGVASAAETIGEQDAHAIGVQAYLYFYSPVTMDITRKQLTNVIKPEGLPMLDMWTDVFASPGWRTTGTRAGDYAVTPPGWSGSLPAGVVRIDAPTPYVWIIGRTKTDGPADYAAVNKIQAELKITPLSNWGKASEPATGSVDPAST